MAMVVIWLLMAQDGVFIFSNTGEIYYHAISENTGTLLPPQANWFLPSYVDYGDSFHRSETYL